MGLKERFVSWINIEKKLPVKIHPVWFISILFPTGKDLSGNIQELILHRNNNLLSSEMNVYMGIQPELHQGLWFGITLVFKLRSWNRDQPCTVVKGFHCTDNSLQRCRGKLCGSFLQSSTVWNLSIKLTQASIPHSTIQQLYTSWLPKMWSPQC